MKEDAAPRSMHPSTPSKKVVHRSVGLGNIDFPLYILQFHSG